jgi:hypothetical protein
MSAVINGTFLTVHQDRRNVPNVEAQIFTGLKRTGVFPETEVAGEAAVMAVAGDMDSLMNGKIILKTINLRKKYESIL